MRSLFLGREGHLMFRRDNCSLSSFTDRTDLQQKTIISHEDEKIALVLSLPGIFTIWFIFR